MSVDYDYRGKIGSRLKVPNNTWTRVPKSRWIPPHGGATLVISPYFNIKYTLPSGSSRPGRLLVRLMRENPNDSTMWYGIWLERGYTWVPDSRDFTKWWSKGDVGRHVHLEVRAERTATCYLNDSCYVSYSQEW